MFKFSLYQQQCHIMPARQSTITAWIEVHSHVVNPLLNKYSPHICRVITVMTRGFALPNVVALHCPDKSVAVKTDRNIHFKDNNTISQAI